MANPSAKRKKEVRGDCGVEPGESNQYHIKVELTAEEVWGSNVSENYCRTSYFQGDMLKG